MFNTEKYLLALVMGFSFMSTAIVAQEEDSDVEEVVVTGSRIATSEFTGAQPVIVLDQEVIARSAELTISDVLREMPINIAGSNYERSGSSAGGTSEISLRGLGSSRTLVLIDGRRVPAHPKTGGESANLNLLPTAAIERVEVLADGASAVYGSDAIGGVVNIITKKDFNGVTISATTSQPDLDGGEEESFSIVGGISTDDSRIMWSYEHQQRDIIYMTNRPYTAGRAPTDGDLGTGFEISSYAWNYQLLEDSVKYPNLKKGQYLPAAECLGDSRFVEDGTTYTWGASGGVLDNDYACAFDYTQIMAENAGKNFDAFTLNFDKDLSNNMNIYSSFIISRNETFGRYAPPAAFINPYPAGLANVRVPAQSDGSAEQVIYGLDVPTKLRKRFIEIGPRASYRTDWGGNGVLGLQGVIGDYSWDLSLQFNKADYDIYDCCYLQKPEYAEAAAAFAPGGAGTFKGQTDLFHPDVVAYYTSSPAQTATTNFKNLEYTIGGPLKMVPNTDFIAGISDATYRYKNLFDKQSEVGNVGGSSGNSDGSTRSFTAMFVETKTAVMDGRGEIQLAVRNDDYSDFGTNTSYTIKGLVEVMEGLTLRASMGTGFRAPGLGDLVANTTFSAEYHYDYTYCAAQGTDRSACKEEQVNTYISANPNLGPEESESSNFGIIYEWGNHSIAVDFFETEIDKVVTAITVQDIIDAEGLGASYVATLAAQGASCDRSPAGKLDECRYNPINGNGLLTSGMDVKYTGLYETGVGDFDVNFSMVDMDKDESEAFYNGPIVNFVGLTATPNYRYTMDVGHALKAMPELYLTMQYEYIDEMSNSYDANYVGTGTVDEWTQVNLRGVYSVPQVDGLNISLTIRNAEKNDPPLTSSGGYRRNLHPIYGMVTTLGFSWDL